MGDSRRDEIMAAKVKSASIKEQIELVREQLEESDEDEQRPD